MGGTSTASVAARGSKRRNGAEQSSRYHVGQFHRFSPVHRGSTSDQSCISLFHELIVCKFCYRSSLQEAVRLSPQQIVRPSLQQIFRSNLLQLVRSNLQSAIRSSLQQADGSNSQAVLGQVYSSWLGQIYSPSLGRLLQIVRSNLQAVLGQLYTNVAPVSVCSCMLHILDKRPLLLLRFSETLVFSHMLTPACAMLSSVPHPADRNTLLECQNQTTRRQFLQLG